MNENNNFSALINKFPELSTAFSLLSDEKFSEAFIIFAECYRKFENEQELYQNIYNIFCKHNLPRLKEIYSENIALIKKYPYKFGEIITDFEKLPIEVFPITEREFSVFNKETKQFSDIITYKTAHETKYFFENIDKPLFIENENNFYNLQFLCDNVRRSEDFGGDNHIYLFYNIFDVLVPLLMLEDFELLLADKKFVFLFGEENRKAYPVDFSDEFGSNFADGAVPLRPEELKRICYWYTQGMSGTEIAMDTFRKNGCISVGYAEMFHNAKLDEDIRFCETERFHMAVVDFEKKYRASDIKEFYDKITDWNTVELKNYYSDEVLSRKIAETKGFSDWLEENYPYSEFDLPYLFRLYIIYNYYSAEHNSNPRIVPAFVWEPHMIIKEWYCNLIGTFKYITVLSSIRNPLIVHGRHYERDKKKYLSASLYVNTFLPSQLRKNFFAYRFEDLKLHPEIICRKLCRLFNVPFDEKMLEPDAPLLDENRCEINGFDPKPAIRDVDKALSAFDKVRLQMLLDPVLKYFDYPSFDFEECPVSDDDIKYLLKFPFKFEKDYINSKMFKVDELTPENRRIEIYNETLNCLRLRNEMRCGNVPMPTFLSIHGENDEP